MLDSEGIGYEYREYGKDPLSEAEIRDVLKKLGRTAADMLRKKDKAVAEAGLTGNETEAQLVKAMAKHPTLLQRPIGIAGKKAVLGRPIGNLLELA
ncbi:arsenate reductase (glutaredoxin) [bacterium]|nr:arsenate reductase (glutaredoxin) [bacterium]